MKTGVAATGYTAQVHDKKLRLHGKYFNSTPSQFHKNLDGSFCSVTFEHRNSITGANLMVHAVTPNAKKFVLVSVQYLAR